MLTAKVIIYFLFLSLLFNILGIKLLFKFYTKVGGDKRLRSFLIKGQKLKKITLVCMMRVKITYQRINESFFLIFITEKFL